MTQARSRALHGAIEGLQRLADLFAQRREQLAQQVGLTVPQWRLLEEIASEDFMPSLFARRRARTAAAVSKALRQLIDADLISVTVSREDGRQRVYTLTARGRRSLARMRKSRARAIEAVWGDLDTRELARFARFSESLGDRLEAYADAQSRGGSRRPGVEAADSVS